MEKNGIKIIKESSFLPTESLTLAEMSELNGGAGICFKYSVYIDWVAGCLVENCGIRIGNPGMP